MSGSCNIKAEWKQEKNFDMKQTRNSILKLISAASNQDVIQTSASFDGEDNAHLC